MEIQLYASISHDQNVPLIMNKNFKINYINRYRMLQIIFKCCGVVCNIKKKEYFSNQYMNDNAIDYGLNWLRVFDEISCLWKSFDEKERKWKYEKKKHDKKSKPLRFLSNFSRKPSFSFVLEYIKTIFCCLNIIFV